MEWLVLLVSVSAQHLLSKNSDQEILTPANIVEGIFAFEFPQLELIERVFQPLEAIEAAFSITVSKPVPESCAEQAEKCSGESSQEEFTRCLAQDPNCKQDLQIELNASPVSTEPQAALIESEGPGVFHYVLMVLVGAACCAVMFGLYYAKFSKKSPAKSTQQIKLKALKQSFP
jgi:hypothetical protein